MHADENLKILLSHYIYTFQVVDLGIISLIPVDFIKKNCGFLKKGGVLNNYQTGWTGFYPIFQALT